MAEAFIVDAVRTPVGRRNGGLSKEHPADLGAHVLKALVERGKFDPKAVVDVVFGCLDTIGPQSGDIARTCWLSAGLPDEVPGVTIDRQCGSSQQAVHFAAQGVMSGTQDLVIAGGVQNMSMIPIASGRPAASQHVRAMSPACGPSWSTQPKTTSSTTIGSRSLRSTMALSTCAPRSAGWTWLRPPPRFPTGVRTASTM